MNRFTPLLPVCLCLAASSVAFSAETDLSKSPIAGVADNSFLISEAYNQEAGVVQHILGCRFDTTRNGGVTTRETTLDFAQEWPVFSQRHQLSYDIPLASVDDGVSRHTGLGDISALYRYQAYLDEKTLTAFAPGAGVILPTGDAERGLGDNTFGANLLLPFSTALSERVAAHANLGAAWLPRAGLAGSRRDIREYTAGASLVYAPSRTTHILLEYSGSWTKDGGDASEFSAVLSPGVRHAFNLASGQLVVGAAVPVGLNRRSPDYGVYLYCSFEHAFADEGGR